MKSLRILKQLLLNRLNILFGGIVDEFKAIQTQQKFREANAALILLGINQRKERQATCTHYHSRLDGGMSYGVYVEAEHGEYVLCQQCLARIRPESQLIEELDKDAIYNTGLFVKLLVEAPAGGPISPLMTGLTPEEEVAADEMPLDELKNLCNISKTV